MQIRHAPNYSTVYTALYPRYCDGTDLLIGGVEASLWLGEQFAAGLNIIFPRLNVRVASANKLLGFSGLTPRQVITQEEITISYILNRVVLDCATRTHAFPAIINTNTIMVGVVRDVSSYLAA